MGASFDTAVGVAGRQPQTPKAIVPPDPQ